MKLLIPLDGSAQALLALKHALLCAAHGLRTELVLANVQEPATVYELLTLHDREALQQVAEAAGRDMLAPAAELARTAGVPFVEVVLVGDPVPMLLEAVETHACRGIVMGSHGHGGLAAWVGSVSRELLETAPVPVTLVRPPAPETA